MPDLRTRLRVGFHWRGGPDVVFADITEWWRDPAVLRELPPALTALVPGAPTVVIGPASRGTLLGALVAAHLGVGLVEVRKNDRVARHSPVHTHRSLPAGYHEGGAQLSFRRALIRPDDRVLCVDDWVESGGQAAAIHAMVTEIGAAWLGLAAVVDDLPPGSPLRAGLGVRSLLTAGDLSE
ncbi:phosphoribosyltransferase family protein [Dactylosporangium matsuzakiense]|uniref:Adenine phosphoribosyltransferase n=1 Tax=Dactylosporangium matsuzakiense TaxID=53360 RepID=A0A9W6NQ41_9ACTN|nr:phosphoribosyltransferase family protein [Dactylosporangium matsuzakiense]UWZ41965.1 adenine phosphoribosyltransferase [Dactylosporangium matsuzakiense]GLL04963.1 adenine phosphoribosyltransferase [Dactylosporangium matsuzakiense]